MKVLVTGATGFLVTILFKRLASEHFDVVGTTRRKSNKDDRLLCTGDIDANTDWKHVVPECEVVIHAAARAPILSKKTMGSAQVYRAFNKDATLKLAEDANAAGVKHFVYMSSAGVNGDKTYDNPHTELTSPNPVSDYAQSKYEAGKLLILIERYKETGRPTTILRPTLIRGENPPGNARRWLKRVSIGLPLPFKNIKNKRSLVSLDNVVDFIVQCLCDARSRTELFLFADVIPRFRQKSLFLP